MDDKKRMMFILEEDYYFITLKLLSILLVFESEKKPFTNYLKLGILYESIKNDTNFLLIKKAIINKNLDLFDSEKLLKIYCDSQLNMVVIKRVLFFLESQKMVIMSKDDSNSSINVVLVVDERVKELINSNLLNEDMQMCMEIKKQLPRLRVTNLETLQNKIFGCKEVK